MKIIYLKKDRKGYISQLSSGSWPAAVAEVIRISQKWDVGAGEMTDAFFLPEVLSLVPSTCIGAPQAPRTPDPAVPIGSLISLGTCIHGHTLI